MPEVEQVGKRGRTGLHMRGYRLPAAWRKKIGDFSKGKTRFERFGEKAEEWRRKISESNKRAKAGKPPTEAFLHSATIHRKGRSYVEIYGARAAEELAKRSAAHRRRYAGKPRKFDLRPYQNGEAKYIHWRKSVFNRDSYTCQACGKHSQNLEAHHIKSWAKFPLLRYEVDNGVTLCKECHKVANRLQREQEKCLLTA